MVNSGLPFKPTFSPTSEQQHILLHYLWQGMVVIVQ